MKKILILLLTVFCLFNSVSAQRYVVHTIKGQPNVVTKQGKKILQVRDKLTLNTVIEMPEGAEIEMVDIENRTQLVIKTCGNGKVSSFLNNKKNISFKLTKQYFSYIMKKVKGDEETVIRTCVDPGITTRRQVKDSTYQQPK